MLLDDSYHNIVNHDINNKFELTYRKGPNLVTKSLRVS